MAEERELTDKEKALVLMGGKDPREVADPENKEEGGDDAAKLEAEAKAKKEQEEAEKLKKQQEEDKKREETLLEVSDEQLLKLASKKAGREIKSWDELKPSPTEEDKKKELDKRDADKLSYGLQKGLFNKSTYESFISDTKDQHGVVYRAELEQAKKDDPEWDEDKEAEFKAEFDERFGLDLDPTSNKYKRGQRQLSALADNILKNTYSNVFSLDSEYDRHEQQMNTQYQNEQKILQAAPVFKKDVDDVLTEYSNVNIAFGGDKYNVPVPKEAIEQVKELLLGQDFVSSQILSGKHTKENLSKIAYNLIITQNFDTLSFEAAKKYHEKHAKGVRGIPPAGRLDTEKVEEPNLNDRQKQALEIMRNQQQPVAN